MIEFIYMKLKTLVVGLIVLPTLFLLSGIFSAPVQALTKLGSGKDDPSIGCILNPAGRPTGSTVPSLGCLAIVLTNIIETLLLFLGVVALFFLLSGSVQFMLSGGDQKALQKAKGTVTFAVVGIAAVLLAYTGISIVTKALNLPDILKNFSLYQP